MAVHGQLPARVLRCGIAELGPEVRRHGLADVLRAEYILLSNAFDGGDWSTSEPYFLPIRDHTRALLKANQTKHLLAEQIRTLIELDEMPASARKRLDFTEYDPAFPKVLLFRSTGRTLMGCVLPVQERALQQSDTAHVGLAMTRALLALMAYRAEKGALPASLQALVSDYVDAIPLDPYTGKELRYAPEKLTLYSTGSDGFDSGGSTEEDPWEALTDLDQPTLRLDPAAWKLHTPEDEEQPSDDGVEE